MISISVSNLTLAFGMDVILEGITFAAEDGDRVGIVGVNGSGKSSLLRMITGEYTPTEGSVTIAKNKTVAMLEQDDAFKTVTEIAGCPVGETVLEQMYGAFPKLFSMERRMAVLEQAIDRAGKSGGHEENVEESVRLSAEYAELSRKYADEGGLHYKSRCRSILEKLGFDEHAQALSVTKLSGGQRTRLALARLLSIEPDILILDEPTNHLDATTMMWLEKHLAGYKKTVLLVSHDRYFLDRVTNKTLDIEHKHGKLYKGGYTAHLPQKELDKATYEKQYKMQQKEIAHIEAVIAKQKEFNRERNIIMAESRQKMLDRMVKLEAPKGAEKSIHMSFTASGESGNEVLRVKELDMGFPARKLFSGLDFLVKKRERVFIAGPNGCGKSTLIKILMGLLSQTGGEIEYGYNVTVGYYDQENQNLNPDKTVLDELWDDYSKLTQTEVRNALAQFLFRGDDIEKKVSVLSGGEKARLTFAKLILSSMNLLILDEPTNHLDIESREVLENALSNFDGTIIAVSHDRYFASKLATRVIELGCGTDGADWADHKFGYAQYLESMEKAVEDDVPAAGGASADKSEKTEDSMTSKERYLAAKQEQAAARKRARRREQVAVLIAQNENRLVEIEEELFGDAATDYVRAGALEDERMAVEDVLLSLYAEEEELAAFSEE